MTAVQSSTRISWNQGRIVGPKPPLKPKHIWAIRTRLQHDGRIRDLAMFNTAIDSKLRGCDLVKLRVADYPPGRQCAVAHDDLRVEDVVHRQGVGRHGAARVHQEGATLVVEPPNTVGAPTEILPPDLAHLVGTVAARLDIDDANACWSCFHAHEVSVPALDTNPRRG